MGYPVLRTEDIAVDAEVEGLEEEAIETVGEGWNGKILSNDKTRLMVFRTTVASAGVANGCTVLVNIERNARKKGQNVPVLPGGRRW